MKKRLPAAAAAAAAAALPHPQNSAARPQVAGSFARRWIRAPRVEPRARETPPARQALT